MISFYGKENCPWCDKAKDKLNQLGMGFTYFPIDKDEGTKKHLLNVLEKYEKPKTVPQIFVSGGLIGGYDNLAQIIDYNLVFTQEGGLTHDDDRTFFIEVLRAEKIHEFEFRKADGSIRRMKGTLNMNFIPQENWSTEKGLPKLSPTEMDYIHIFDTEKQAWRSMRWDSFMGFKYNE